jgi:hypothetical protein
MSNDFTFTSGNNADAEAADSNVLNQLKAVIQKTTKREDIFIQVPERDGVLVRVSPNITQNQLRAWRRNAGDDTKKGLDTLKFSCNVIAATCTGIMINDEIVTNDMGVEVTFASQEIMQMTGTSRPHPDCVQAFFGLEPHIEAAAVAIIEASGYGDAVEAVDPTKRSSEN